MTFANRYKTSLLRQTAHRLYVFFALFQKKPDMRGTPGFFSHQHFSCQLSAFER